MSAVPPDQTTSQSNKPSAGYRVIVHCAESATSASDSLLFTRLLFTEVLKKLLDLQRQVERGEMQPVRDVTIEWKD